MPNPLNLGRHIQISAYLRIIQTFALITLCEISEHNLNLAFLLLDQNIGRLQIPMRDLQLDEPIADLQENFHPDSRAFMDSFSISLQVLEQIVLVMFHHDEVMGMPYILPHIDDLYQMVMLSRADLFADFLLGRVLDVAFFHLLDHIDNAIDLFFVDPDIRGRLEDYIFGVEDFEIALHARLQNDNLLLWLFNAKMVNKFEQEKSIRLGARKEKSFSSAIELKNDNSYHQEKQNKYKQKRSDKKSPDNSNINNRIIISPSGINNNPKQTHHKKQMSKTKRVTPRLNILEHGSSFQNNGSNLSINESYLHEGYQSYMETTASRCHHCRSSGSSALMTACDCDDRFFHQACLKEWIKGQIQGGAQIGGDGDGVSQLKCGQCGYLVRFRRVSRCRLRSCAEVQAYCTSHKLLTAGVVLSITLLLAAVVFVILLQTDTLQLSNEKLQKSILLIAIAVVSGVLALGVACCCLECLRTHDTSISTMYNREGKSHRSSRSRRSNYEPGRSPKGGKLVVESVQ